MGGGVGEGEGRRRMGLGGGGGFLTGTESIFNSHHPLIISSYSPRNPKVNIPAISSSSFFPLLSLFPWPSLGRAPSAHPHDGDGIMYK